MSQLKYPETPPETPLNIWTFVVAADQAHWVQRFGALICSRSLKMLIDLILLRNEILLPKENIFFVIFKINEVYFHDISLKKILEIFKEHLWQGECHCFDNQSHQTHHRNPCNYRTSNPLEYTEPKVIRKLEYGWNHFFT